MEIPEVNAALQNPEYIMQEIEIKECKNKDNSFLNVLYQCINSNV